MGSGPPHLSSALHWPLAPALHLGRSQDVGGRVRASFPKPSAGLWLQGCPALPAVQALWGWGGGSLHILHQLGSSAQ